MAHRIIEAGHDATLWARHPETLAPFADTDAAVAGSPAELGGRSDVVCICVVGDADVTAVVDGPREAERLMMTIGSIKCPLPPRLLRLLSR